MITFFQLLEHYGIDPKGVKLVRHGNKEIPILETFRHNRKKLEAYQSFQKPGKFADASHVAVFAPSLGTSALLLGLWEIKATILTNDLTQKLHAVIDKYGFPESWHDDHAWYDLVLNTAIDELSERLIIEWGPGTIAWVQKKDKKILEIKGEQSIGDFISYDQVRLGFYDLKKLVSHSSSNFSFASALKAVNGVYLIRDKSTGSLYVGSAYGDDGVLGRWSNYAKNGHGGNKNLKALDPNNFEFSIVEIVPPMSSPEEVVRREMRWQEKLGTRDFGGLNRR
jgi:hypothetical protein